MSTPLFSRDWAVTVDTLDLSKLDFRFHAEKSVKSTPNKLKLEVYNLSPDHAQEIAKRAPVGKATGLRVELSAGYVDNVPLIFRGDAHKVYTDLQGADRVTLITAMDGGRAYRESRINVSLAPGATVQSAIQQCANALGIGAGNTNELVAGAQAAALGATFATGTVLSGKATDELTRLTKAAGFQWSIQNGTLQLQQAGKPLATDALRLASDTGMIGSPTTDMDASVATTKPKKAKATHVVVKTLMIPGLVPGRIVVLDAQSLSGNYMAVQCDYTGDTAGNDWYITSKLSPY